jgi:NADH:ubiquinone oxidoreductase subunit 6 (subunit J)
LATEVLWWIFAAAVVATSAGVVFSRSIIHSAIWLIGSLAGVGAMYVFLTVEFLALVQFLIYGGAVTVLILLALMLTRTGSGGPAERSSGPPAPFALVVSGGLAAILIGVGVTTHWPNNVSDKSHNIPLDLISQKLFVDFGPPFIIASALLLVALIGAIILARQEEGE